MIFINKKAKYEKEKKNPFVFFFRGGVAGGLVGWELDGRTDEQAQKNLSL